MDWIVKIAVCTILGTVLSSCVLRHEPFTDSALVTVDEDSSLYVFYPNFTDVEFRIGKCPDVSDTNVILCCGAAFTGTRKFRADSSNVAGPYVSDGIYHEGYPCLFNTSVFAFYDGRWTFAADSLCSHLSEAVTSRGMAFSQIPILPLSPSDVEPEKVYWSIGKYRCYRSRDGKILIRRRHHRYRALCEKNGALCIAQTKDACSYPEFCDCLKIYGMDKAIYLDVGLGWSHGWYRVDKDKVHSIGEYVHPFVSNWLVFVYGQK